MSEIKQAGQFKVEAWTGGWPVWCHVYWDNGTHGEKKFHGLKVDDLRDLRYCLDEMIRKLEAATFTAERVNR